VLNCQPTCAVTCNGIGGGGCYTSATTVVAGTVVTCNSASVGATTASANGFTCTNGTAITISCVGPSGSASNFNTQALVIQWLNLNSIPYFSSGTACNAVCTGTSATNCGLIGNTFTCGPCFSGCTGGIGNGQVVIICNQGTTAAQSTCFSQASCWGFLFGASSSATTGSATSPCTFGCGVFGCGLCPGCGGSKKGLLGLLGLLGLIPLLLCCSLLCLLLLCCIRRRKAAPPVHFATFDAAQTSVCGPVPVAGSICPTAPMMAPVVV